MTQCKRWKAEHFNYLCGHTLYPDSNTPECPVCIKPSVSRGVCPSTTAANCVGGIQLPDRMWFENTSMTEINSNGEYTITGPSTWPLSELYYKTTPVSTLNTRTYLTRDISMGYSNSPCVWTNLLKCRRWYKLREHLISEASGNQITDQCPGSTNPFTPSYGYTIYGGNYFGGWSLGFVGGGTGTVPAAVRLYATRTYTAYNRFKISSTKYAYQVWTNGLGDIKSPSTQQYPVPAGLGSVGGGIGPGFVNIYGQGNSLGYGLAFAVWEMKNPCSAPVKSKWTMTRIYTAAEDTTLGSQPGIWPTNIPNTITLNVSV